MPVQEIGQEQENEIFFIIYLQFIWSIVKSYIT